MNPTPKRLWIAALLAASGAVAIAQSPAQPAAGEQPPRAASAEVRRAAPRDPAQWQQRMAERHAQRLAQLKTALKLSAAQEGAWNQFVAASQPPALRTPPARPDFAQLSTPERSPGICCGSARVTNSTYLALPCGSTRLISAESE